MQPNTTYKGDFFMKRTIRTVALILAVVIMAAFALTGCEMARKLQGAEMTFPAKISDAKTFSFKMKIDYKKGATNTVINMDCYKQTAENGSEEYAYCYSCPQGAHQSYKNIYADGKLYEIANFSEHTGSYYVKDDVNVDAEGNIIYHIKQNILLLSVAAMVGKANKETLNGEQVYRYDVDINDKSASIWYNSEVLVKCYIKFVHEDDEDEEYTLTLSDYTFDEELPAEIFARPDTYGLGYIESPFSFETWMEIITTFSKKLK